MQTFNNHSVLWFALVDSNHQFYCTNKQRFAKFTIAKFIVFKEFGVIGTGAHSVQVSPEKDERHKPHHYENGQQATPGQEHTQVVTCTSVGAENTKYYNLMISICVQ